MSRNFVQTLWSFRCNTELFRHLITHMWLLRTVGLHVLGQSLLQGVNSATHRARKLRHLWYLQQSSAKRETERKECLTNHTAIILLWMTRYRIINDLTNSSVFLFLQNVKERALTCRNSVPISDNPWNVKDLLNFVVDYWVANDILPIDTCVITFFTLERLGALMIEHVFLQNGPQDLL